MRILNDFLSRKTLGIDWNTLHKSQPPIVPEPMKKISNGNLNKQREISTFLDRFIKVD